MRRHAVARIFGLVMVLSMLGGAVASAENYNAQRMLFLRNDGADCGANARPHLANAPGTNDLGCGYIGGGPFGEVFTTAGVSSAKVYATQSPLNLQVDAARNITGRMTITPYVQGPAPTGSGVGQIIVDLTATAVTDKGEALTLGTQRLTATANPATSRQELDFSMPVDAATDGATMREFALTVNIRGIHAAHGFHQLNGHSFVRLPFTPAPAPQPEPDPDTTG